MRNLVVEMQAKFRKRSNGQEKSRLRIKILALNEVRPSKISLPIEILTASQLLRGWHALARALGRVSGCRCVSMTCVMLFDGH